MFRFNVTCRPITMQFDVIDATEWTYLAPKPISMLRNVETNCETKHALDIV
ncbi:MAG: hypothetical protein ACTS80_00625 [Candidatus Hodgkinia cicadicola]